MRTVRAAILLVLALASASGATAQWRPGLGCGDTGVVETADHVTVCAEGVHIDSPFVTASPGEALELNVVAKTRVNATFEVTFTVDNETRNATVDQQRHAAFEFDVRVPILDADAFRIPVVYSVAVRNGTNVTEVARGTFDYPVDVVGPFPFPTGPGVPAWVWAVGAVIVVGAGVAVLRFRTRQVKVAPRSRTLQELEVETKAERARPKDAATIAAEYEAVQRKEAERLATREESILAAKRADIQKSIDLARQRHERGELSEFQFRKLKENKEKQLAELEDR